MSVELYNHFSPAGGSYLTGQEKRDRQWDRTPNFLNVKAKDLPMNPYRDFKVLGSATRTAMSTYNSFSDQSYTSYLEWPQHDDTLSGVYSVGADLVRSNISLQNEALTKTLVKVSDVKTNLAVMFAEKAKTHQLIMDTASRIHKAMHLAARGDHWGAARVLNFTPKRAHKSWLEYKYGWTPLLMDVKGSAEFFAQQFSYQKPPSFVASAKTKDTLNHRVSAQGPDRHGVGVNRTKTVYNVEHVKVCHVKLWCEISNPTISQMQQLGVTNPLLVAWELVPFSFVFDWFISVGDWLQGLTALHGVTVRKSMVSHLYTRNASAVETFSGAYVWPVSYFGYSNTRRAKVRTYTRDPLTASELASIVPVVNDPTTFGWQKIVTSLALMRGQASKLRL